MALLFVLRMVLKAVRQIGTALVMTIVTVSVPVTVAAIVIVIRTARISVSVKDISERHGMVVVTVIVMVVAKQN